MTLRARIGRMRETFPGLAGTLVSQTLLNIVALALLGTIIVSSTDLFQLQHEKLFVFSFVPLALLVVVLVSPGLDASQRQWPLRAGSVQRCTSALLQVRAGLAVFRQPRYGIVASAAQLGALGDPVGQPAGRCSQRSGSMTTPASAAAAGCCSRSTSPRSSRDPANIGVFSSRDQCAAYRIRYQHRRCPRLWRDSAGVEIATAVALGLPLSSREGLTGRSARPGALLGSGPPRAAPVRRIG